MHWSTIWRPSDSFYLFVLEIRNPTIGNNIPNPSEIADEKA